MALGGCGGGALSNIKNPFADKETILPGERIAVITDPGEFRADQIAAKPVSLPPAQTNAAWSQPGGVPANNLGHLALGGSLRKVWAVDAGSGSSSSGRLSAVPLVAEGKVFTLDAAGNVSAFSSASGATVWRASVTPENERSSEGFGGGLALDGGRLYVTTGYGTVVALDAGNGSVQWTKSVGEPIRNSPTAAGGKVYFVSTANTLHALNGTDGQELWKARGLPQTATLLSNASPAVSGGIVVAPFPAGDVAAFEAGSGKTAWSDSLTRTSETTASGILGDPARPVIDRDIVFAVSHGGRMIATSASSGARVWTRNLASTQMPWVAGDAVFVVDVAGRLMALGRSDGQVRWVSELPTSTRWSGPVLAGDKLWVVSGEGLLVGADARTGQVANQVDLNTDVFVAPVVAGGRMYILSDDADLIALN
ncbi:MAG: PQQ-binding-like beta-propeller repeat protein [Methyloceanibacter sp.]|uniref:PQQ-like beta-propeller repeat protein n=1 Tax=Methyloceanibacter sp. TaxID=1965321 RepID=UPI003D6C9AD7